jgi:hypothetical protein
MKGGFVMILGMSLATFTQFHVIISLIAIIAGIVAVFGMLNAKLLPGTHTVFLVTSVLTDITGFMFPQAFDAADVVGIISLAFCAAAILALYSYKLAGAWRGIYAVTAVVVLYFNCFVLVAQAFGKVPFLHALAPTQKEPPFAIAQGALLILFVGLGIAAFRKFRPGMPAAVLA